MNLDNLNIRNATRADIDQIVSIKVYGWKSAYINIIDNKFLNDMSEDKERKAYTNKYSLDDVFVAETNDDIVGFCRIYDYKESPYDDKEIDCEIREIYVKPEMKRMGIGSKLFSYVLEYLKNEGKRKLYLGVFENNYKSRKFYEKMGGTPGKKGSLEIKDKEYPIVSYIYYLDK